MSILEIKKLSEILSRFEDGELVDASCRIHGNQLHLSISNQGGYDYTYACIECLRELIANLYKE
jgi:hypothetical protein